MDRRSYIATLGTAAATWSGVGLAGCLALGADEDGEYDIGMTANAFDPDAYEIAVGETVVWRNTSSRGHTVTAYEGAIPDDAAYFASGGFASEAAARDAWNDDFGGNIPQNDTYEHTFEVPGTYEYACLPHERGGMVGTIVVSE